MWEWSDTLQLGKGSAFVKRNLRLLPLTDAECEADFFLDPESAKKRQARWTGMVIEREFGAVLAMKDVDWPPPTVTEDLLHWDAKADEYDFGDRDAILVSGSI